MAGLSTRAWRGARIATPVPSTSSAISPSRCAVTAPGSASSSTRTPRTRISRTGRMREALGGPSLGSAWSSGSRGGIESPALPRLACSWRPSTAIRSRRPRRRPAAPYRKRTRSAFTSSASPMRTSARARTPQRSSATWKLSGSTPAAAARRGPPQRTIRGSEACKATAPAHSSASTTSDSRSRRRVRDMAQKDIPHPLGGPTPEINSFVSKL